MNDYYDQSLDNLDDVDDDRLTIEDLRDDYKLEIVEKTFFYLKEWINKESIPLFDEYNSYDSFLKLFYNEN